MSDFWIRFNNPFKRSAKKLGACTAIVAFSSVAIASILSFPPRSITSLFTSRSHESITNLAVLKLSHEFFGVHNLNPHMREALEFIVTANADVDNNQVEAALHFDGESFPEGQERLINLRREIVSYMDFDDIVSAREGLGQALHSIQDFYAHSNWVELGHKTPSPDLGRPGRQLRRLSSEVKTCDAESLITAELTSGYFGGEDRVPSPGKCRHGGPFDKSPGTGGINKDTIIEIFSPHWHLHKAAADLAEMATRQFLQDVRDILTVNQLRRLFGLS